MRSLILTVFVAVFLAVVPSAGAVTLVNVDGTRAEPFQGWADAARVPTPTGIVTVFDGSICPPPHSCARARESRIGLARTNDHELFHELGHIYDAQMPQWKRDTFLRVTGRTSRPWRGLDAVYADGSEIFAEAYGACAVGVSRRGGRRIELQYDFATRRVTLRRVCRLIRQPNT